MNFKNTFRSPSFIILSAVAVFNLSACEQRYVVKSSGAMVAPQNSVHTPSDGTVKNPDGSTTVKNPDGSTVISRPDRTITVTQPDGTSVTRKPDGTTITHQPDGTTVTHLPDGTVVTQKPDGTVVKNTPDGTTVITSPDGTTTTTKPNGTTITTKPDGTKIMTNPDGTTTTINPDGSTNSTESFSATSKQTKKLDFLFVVDNSPSMADNQKKLGSGFRAFANTFYRRSDLDICTMIITSDRYLGKEGYRGYERERTLPCTKPAGYESWSDSQKQAHIDQLISDFEEKIYVGTRGSITELLGKSVVSFLHGLGQWGESAANSTPSTFFRKDAVANISFLTDENNYYFGTPAVMDEAKNDLPFATNTAIPGSKNGELDSRVGVKEYLDAYFTALNPGRPLTYSTTSILELSKSIETMPGIADNLNRLPEAVGRESTRGDISGPVQAYTDVYQKMADAIVLRATTYTLAHAMHTGLKVQIRRSNGDALPLKEGADFVMQSPTVLTLNPQILPKLQSGDKIEVSYNFLPNQN